MEINLVDSNFVGRDLNSNPRYFKWVVDNRKVSEHIFFTDNMLHKADKLKTDQIKIAWLLEPKAISPNIYSFIENNYKQFDKVLTFDRDLLSVIDNGLFCPYGTFWVDVKEQYNKTNLVSMILSHKNYTVGQNFRHQVLNKKFKEIHYYGNFESSKQIKSKNEALDSYYFSVSIENSIQNSYWTEKLLDCFITKTIPIYYGTKDVGTFFNKKGIIFVNDIDHLQKILNTISPEIYNERKEYIEENYNLAKKYKDPEDYIYFNYKELLR